MKTGTSGLLSEILFSMRIGAIKKYIKPSFLLEVGCGGWPIVRRLKIGNYLGVDLEKKAIEKVKNIYSEYNFMVLDIEKDGTSCLHKRFDSIVMLAVVEHFYNPQKAILELGSKLKPGGVMVITTPTKIANLILSMGARFKLFDKNAATDHHNILTKNNFFEISKKVGLELQKYERFGFGMNQLIIFQKEG